MIRNSEHREVHINAGKSAGNKKSCASVFGIGENKAGSIFIGL
jgi:hypothetical protein